MDGLQSPVDFSILAQQRHGEPKIPTVRNAEEAHRAAKDFEAFFLSQMVGTMFSGIKTEGPFGGGFSETIYKSMLAEEYGKAMAQRGGVGIADSVQREILKLQEVDGHAHDSSH